MTTSTDIVQFVKAQLSTDSRDSKKWLSMQMGLISVLVVAGCAGLIFLFGPAAVASYVATVAQIAITAIGGLVATYITGQAATEWKANSVLNTSAQQPATLSPGNTEEPTPVVITNPAPIPVTETGGTGGTGQMPKFNPNSGSTGTPPSKPFSASATEP